MGYCGSNLYKMFGTEIGQSVSMTLPGLNSVTISHTNCCSCCGKEDVPIANSSLGRKLSRWSESEISIHIAAGGENGFAGQTAECREWRRPIGVAVCPQQERATPTRGLPYTTAARFWDSLATLPRGAVPPLSAFCTVSTFSKWGIFQTP